MAHQPKGLLRSLAKLSRDGSTLKVVTRTICIPLTANRFDLIREGSTLFFPKGESIYGREEGMTFSLPNFRDEEVGLHMETVKREIAFHLRNYIEAHKLKTVFLYLRSRCIDPNDADHRDSGNKLLPMLTPKVKRVEQPREFASEKQEDSNKKKTELRQAHCARVPPEPTESFVTVRVHHVTITIQERRFASCSPMSTVHDWARSLCEEPENFTLCDAFGLPLLPSDLIQDRCLISMVASEETPFMCFSDCDIHFRGFGCCDNELEDTLEDLLPTEQH